MMGKSDLFIETAFLATKDRHEDKVLLCNRVDSNDGSGDFLFYLFEILDGNQEALLKKVGQTISTQVKKTIGVSPEGFESILATINHTLEKLTGPENSSWIGKMNAIVGFVQGGNIFLSQTGNIVGYIFHKNKISSLTEQAEDTAGHPGRTFTEIVSGTISAGDQIILSNVGFFGHVSIDKLRTLVKLDNIRSEILELKKQLGRNHITDTNAVLIQASNTQRESELDEMIFLDEPEETTFTYLNKEVLPKIKKSWKKTLEYFADLGDKAKEWIDKNRKNWDKKYGPETKKFLNESGKKIQSGLIIGQEKFLEFRNNSTAEKSTKIKTNRYEKNKSTVSHTMKNLTDWAKNADLFSSSKKKIYIAILIFIVIIFGYGKIAKNNTQKAETAKQVEINAAYDQAKAAFDSAQKDKTTDLNRYYNVISLAEKAKNGGSNVDKSSALIAQVNAIIDTKTKMTRFTATNGFVIAQNTKQIALVGSNIYGVTSDGKVYSVDTRDKSPKLVGASGKENGNIISIAYSPTSNSIYMSTDTKRMLSLDLTSNVIGKLTNGDTNSDWKAAKSFAVYSTNFYTLDNNYAGIWKYSLADAATYGKSSAYIDIKKTSLPNAVDIAIDGNVYVLSSDGTVAKLVRGTLDPGFTLKDISAPKNILLQPAKIFTSEDTTNIFVLDKSLNRIVKFDKSGGFSSQYTFDGITVENFVVNAKLQKIWALSDGKLYEGNL